MASYLKPKQYAQVPSSSCVGLAHLEMVGREEEDYPDEMEERLVNEEYKIWKKNTPFLYGTCYLS